MLDRASGEHPSRSSPSGRGIPARTDAESYTSHLLASVWWKRLLNAQAPYRWNLRRLRPGFTLDFGCGVGRNLLHLDGRGVGIDHNLRSVEIARERGLTAFTPAEFTASPFNAPAAFDSLLLAHVAEHMSDGELIDLLIRYRELVKPGGRVILITPQELGFRVEPSHVQFMDFAVLRRVAEQSGLEPEKEYSFPFPRLFGGVFRYNEFVSVNRKP